MAGDEIFEAYVQADAPLRKGLFDDLVRGLQALARASNHETARRWACRAVSPDLDYTSLLKLRRYIVPGKDVPEKPRALRLAVLGGPTTTQLVQFLDVFLLAEGIDCEIYEGEYGLFRQEILNSGSGLARFHPQIVFLAVGPQDVTYEGIGVNGSSMEAALNSELEQWSSLWETAHQRWECVVLQNLFPIEPWNALGHFAWKHPVSRERFLQRLNMAIAEKAPSHVAVHPLPQLVAEAGASSWFDPRFYFEAKMPCAPENLSLYAYSVMSLIRAMRGKSKRVLALDLDNTLWGGVIGDVGPGGIVLGQGSGEGEAFLQFQKHVQSLRQRGVVLAVCSKNDEARALEPFNLRADMALKRSDFACFVANWENKADNLRSIAEELNLGLDAFVFVDDNPAERALVRRFLPEVAVPDMPEDPAEFVRALARHRYFETVSLTAEDVKRSRYYEQNAQRRKSAVGNGDLESFLASLDMGALVEPVNELNIQRVTQLVNKSNQFNLTTHRRTFGEIQEIAGNAEWKTLTISLSDKFGDNGLISVIFLRLRGDAMEIDTWLMSCRVLQRGVEQFVLNEIVRCARDLGCGVLRGVYIPTDKNGLVKEHYEKLGFHAAGAEGESTRWEFLIKDSWKPFSTHIRKAVNHG